MYKVTVDVQDNCKRQYDPAKPRCSEEQQQCEAIPMLLFDVTNKSGTSQVQHCVCAEPTGSEYGNRIIKHTCIVFSGHRQRQAVCDTTKFRVWIRDNVSVRGEPSRTLLAASMSAAATDAEFAMSLFHMKTLPLIGQGSCEVVKLSRDSLATQGRKYLRCLLLHRTDITVSTQFPFLIERKVAASYCYM